MPVYCPQRYLFRCQLGWFGLLCDQSTPHRITFGHPCRAGALRALAEFTDGAMSCRSEKGLARPLRELVGRIRSYAAGEVQDFRDVKIGLEHLNMFSRRVVKLCREVRYGETIEYGQLARRAGSPAGARAVGQVMALNRLPLIVPCHRVVSAGGRMGGFSAGGGVATKRRLLAMEAAGVTDFPTDL
ncbi:MAG: methylated-DNA--[protein]-cysteine S-methyltransferase [Pirellulales bacterium]|nr:methylated-DNA--[protein]-cysteine S-methyltransferase [Pirellulales bacterium]